MKRILILLALIISINCFAQETKWNIWVKKYEGQKNYFPEYGNLPKSNDELKSDNDFMESMTELGYSKEEGAKQLASKGWSFLRQGDLENAMLRFNQAWLLDKTNVNALWGFGTIMGTLENPDESIKYLELAYKQGSNTHRLLIDIAAAYLVKYNYESEKNDLNLGLSRLLEYLKIDSKNEEALYKTSIFYFHLEDYKSSWKYLHKCYDNGGRPVQQGFVDALKSKMKDPKK